MQKKYGYFSAAMYAGIEAYPNDIRGYWRDFEGGTCAMGAGLAMLSEEGDALVHATALKAFPYLNTEAECPHCQIRTDLFDVAHHLYESHGLTRKATADWLYAEEEKLGWVTIDTEALKPEVALDQAPMKVSAQFPS